MRHARNGRRVKGQMTGLTDMRAMAAIFFLAAAVQPAWAQDTAGTSDPMRERLSAEKVGDVETGNFSAGETLSFTLQPYGDKYLLRFTDSPERYVLSVQRSFLGGRTLRYDTGATALRVSVWGGMTLYTTVAPGGLPATRTGDDEAGARAPVSREDLMAALSDEERHLAYIQNIHIRFSADPAVLSAKDVGLAFDALVSAEAGLEKLIAAPGGRAALAGHFDSVRLSFSAKPSVTVSGKTLVVGFAPNAGAAGRASSREVAMELGKMLQIAEAG